MEYSHVVKLLTNINSREYSITVLRKYNVMVQIKNNTHQKIGDETPAKVTKYPIG